MLYKGKVYIVDDDESVTQALEWLLKSVRLQTQVFHSPREFLDTIHELARGCILLDVRMPQLSGMEVLKTLRERKILLPVIVITAHGDISMAVKAIKDGAVDFITKPFNEHALLELIQLTLEGEFKQRARLEETVKVTKCYQSLTEREQQILKLIASGTLNKLIASKLNIAISTVEMHRSKIMQKMEVEHLAQLIRKTLLLENNS